MTRLLNKVAVVTGAASGIGAAIAKRFHEHGAYVVAADISGQQDAIATELGERCIAVQVDVRNSQQVKAMLDAAVEHFGGLDILCNNAGIEGSLAFTADYDEDEFEEILAINCRGVFLGMRHAIAIMAQNGGGSIINIASAAGLVAFPGMSAYCASKGAVRMLSKTAATEYGSQGIRVNSICPGVIATPLVSHIPTEIVDAVKQRTPLGRLGQPQEIADLAVYLGSDESGFVTGADMLIDGGMAAL